MATKDISRAPAERAEGGKPEASVQRMQAVLDFISKCFYPAILVGVILLLRPSLSEVDVKKLVERLHSVKGGGYELTLEQAETAGSQTAPLNGRVAELERTLVALKADLARVQDNVTQAKPTAEQLQARAKADGQFKANSAFVALVFHSPDSRSASKQVTDGLLKAGFKASDTETDFSELPSIPQKANLVHLSYSDKGRDALDEVERAVKAAYPGGIVERRAGARQLRHGDVQVFVY